MAGSWTQNKPLALPSAILALGILAVVALSARKRGASVGLQGVQTTTTASAAFAAPTRQRRHHIYSAAANPYGCDFAGLPGAWTGSTKPGQDSSALFGTAISQAAIWRHQHPADCSRQRFLLHRPQNGGIGAQVHVIGAALALALDLGRVLLLQYDPEFTLFTEDACTIVAGLERRNLDECYFRRLSNCSIADVPRQRVREYDARRQQHSVKALRDIHGHNATRRGATYDEKKAARRRVPLRFRALLEASPIAEAKRYYWWRAQSAAYIVRPNERTLQRLAALRQQTLRDAPPSLASAVSVHVRHGDKWREAKQVPAPVYFERAQALQAEPGSGLQRQIFLSTEDPEVVGWFKSNATEWRVCATDSQRKPDRRKSTREYTLERGPATEMLDSLLNLEAALQCGGWVGTLSSNWCRLIDELSAAVNATLQVGTLSSNWCRLIDELRATVRCKAGGRYLDARQDDPPSGLSWR